MSNTKVAVCVVVRVTILGEFLPTGDCFLWAVFLNFYTVKNQYLLHKTGWAKRWALLFQTHLVTLMVVIIHYVFVTCASFMFNSDTACRKFCPQTGCSISSCCEFLSSSGKRSQHAKKTIFNYTIFNLVNLLVVNYSRNLSFSTLHKFVHSRIFCHNCTPGWQIFVHSN
jgi:hypothetical protein